MKYSLFGQHLIINPILAVRQKYKTKTITESIINKALSRASRRHSGIYKTVHFSNTCNERVFLDFGPI